MADDRSRQNPPERSIEEERIPQEERTGSPRQPEPQRQQPGTQKQPPGTQRQDEQTREKTNRPESERSNPERGQQRR